MDMKQILHGFVNAQSAPIGGTDDIKKLIGIINEGANHNVSLPVQMAMQHYSEPTKKLSQKPSMLRRYFVEAEESIYQEKVKQRQRSNQYAKVIAERLMMKENYNQTISPNSGFKPGPNSSGVMSNEGTRGSIDTVTVDVPLLIRLLEYAREDAKSDIELHNIAEVIISLGITGKTLTMGDYGKIIGDNTKIPRSKNND